MPMWIPSLIGATLRVWLKAIALALDDTDPVASWTDSSGNGKHAAQATEGFRPVYAASGINGLPAVHHEDADRFLSITSMGWAKPVSAFAVIQPTAESPSANSGVLNVTGCLHRVQDGTGAGVNDWFVNGGAALEYGLNAYDLNPRIHSLVLDGANSLGALDGVVVTGDTGSTALGTTLNIGAGGGFALPMYLGEVLIIDGALGAADRQRTEGYLAHTWGLAANLASDHPYKLRPAMVGDRAGLRYSLGSGLRQRTLG